jgi:hypothetical protein
MTQKVAADSAAIQCINDLAHRRIGHDFTRIKHGRCGARVEKPKPALGLGLWATGKDEPETKTKGFIRKRWFEGTRRTAPIMGGTTGRSL